jgi:predicted nucleotidyltransferase
MAPTFHSNGLQVIDQEVVDGVVRRIVDRFDPIRIFVYGSAARGEAGPDSDLDPFIEKHMTRARETSHVTSRTLHVHVARRRT